MKKVIFILIDSLMPHVLEKQWDQLPGLSFLKKKGHFYPEMVTVFPTMTASVDSSLMTGCYPDQHRVPGLVWYNPITKKGVNYVNGGISVWKMGIRDCFRNVLFEMNETHLSRDVKTVFEECSALGKTSASINFVIHRGHRPHSVHIPWLMKWLLGWRRFKTVSGPDLMTLGKIIRPDFVHSAPASGLFQYYGINDKYAAGVTCQMIRLGKQPDLTMVYLPDNDHKVHKTNPDHAEEPLIQADQHICQILDAYDSWDKAIEENVFLIASDHGQTRVLDDSGYNVDLDQILHDFSIVPVGKKASPMHEVALANNERMCYIYPLGLDIQPRLIERLSHIEGIDLVAWKDLNGVRVRRGRTQNQELFFAKGGTFVDPYGMDWVIEGDPGVLDMNLAGNELMMGDYPDALSRLYGALYAQDIPLIVVNAAPRYEFKTAYFPTHLGGGSHGSLHRFDSTIPFIVAGTEERLSSHPRLVDLKAFILKLLTP
jgi:predicted AlkP superfamily pyrophosphatase or phosphodiesterase